MTTMSNEMRLQRLDRIIAGSQQIIDELKATEPSNWKPYDTGRILDGDGDGNEYPVCAWGQILFRANVMPENEVIVNVDSFSDLLRADYEMDNDPLWGNDLLIPKPLHDALEMIEMANDRNADSPEKQHGALLEAIPLALRELQKFREVVAEAAARSER